jgi:hypothetical protein
MKKFNDLTLKGQKMRIVKDAIAQIKNKVIIPTEGDYMILNYHGDLIDIQKILKLKKKDTCQACAKGSIFAACVLNTNKVNRKDEFDSEWFQKAKLSKWFSALELDMIETAFETSVVKDSTGSLETAGFYTNYRTELGDKCVAFGEKYKTSRGRLLGILNNVLKNGSFKP